MGFSVAAATAILLTTFLFIFCLSYFEMSENFDRLKKGLDERNDRAKEKEDTAIEILNASYNSTTLIINVSNNGSSVLKVIYVDVLINGTVHTNNITATSVNGILTGIWLPGEVLQIELNYTVSPPERLKVVTENGVGAYYLLT